VRDGQFGNWLEGARDWSISRNRFWGSPIPVWKSDDPAHPRIDVYGSLDEIEADFGVRPTDLHRPYIDELTRPNPDDPTGRSTMRRVPEVLDCWFESGSMPFAQLHYPFENREWFEDHYPGDFIVEYVAQTRGWFYTLHVLATALFDRPAFRNCICHGVVLDEDGRKLSKRLRNYPDPEAVFESHGADALRWFLVSSPILRGLDFRIDRDGAGIGEVVRLVLNPIWNAFHFFTLYANADGHRAEVIDATDPDAARRLAGLGVLDRYILAKTRALVDAVTACLDGYDLAGACVEVRAYLDALNNWYIRRSRDRFWSPSATSAPDDARLPAKADAYDTLYTVLTTLTRLTAPLLPMVSEEVYTGLTGAGSVHLAEWPDPATLPADAELVAAMDRVRDLTTAALSLREVRGLRTRLPLARLTVAGPEASALAPYVQLLADEVNVKAVELTDDLSSYGSFVLRPLGKVLGPKLGGDTQAVMAAARSGAWEPGPEGTVVVSGHTLEPGEFELALKAHEGEATAAVRTNDMVVNLDTEVTDELAAEGAARDLIRAVNDIRRGAGLAISDRIRLRVAVPADRVDDLRAHRGRIAADVLAEEVEVVPATDDAAEGQPVAVGAGDDAATVFVTLVPVG
jgi:isoleucyl-tRNA synthetase